MGCVFGGGLKYCVSAKEIQIELHDGEEMVLWWEYKIAIR